MADPLSVAASLLAIVTAAAKSTKSLYETVKRFKERDKTLRRLQDELGDLMNVLESLTQATDVEESMLMLLQSPVKRCSQVCREFEKSMVAFGGKSRTGFRDWAKMEFMRGDINEFIDTIAGYKSTISISLGTITLHASKVSRQVLEEYTEVVKDTAHNLELHLQRVNEKMTQFTVENSNTTGINIDLEDEREVTKQCLRICEDAKAHIESLTNEEPVLLQEASQTTLEGYSFEAQLRTRQALNEHRDSFAETIGYLRRRLETLVKDEGPGNESERLRLQSDINTSKQCLEICKMAGEISRQKVYRIGEVIADGDSDQVVVTTLADLFDIKKALSRGTSAQLVGSMSGEELKLLTEKRYSSRFGAVPVALDGNKAETTSSKSAPEFSRTKQTVLSEADSYKQSPGSRTTQNRPSSNEMRKRQSGGDSA